MYVDLRKRLAEAHPLPQYEYLLAHAYRNLGVAYRASKPELVEKTYVKALERTEELTKKYADQPMPSNLDSLADWYVGTNRLELADKAAAGSSPSTGNWQANSPANRSSATTSARPRKDGIGV